MSEALEHRPPARAARRRRHADRPAAGGRSASWSSRTWRAAAGLRLRRARPAAGATGRARPAASWSRPPGTTRATYRDVAARRAAAGSRVFLAGHQPQLFHPGRVVQEFRARARSPRRTARVAVNLAIDSDTIKTASLRVPTGTPEPAARRERAVRPADAPRFPTKSGRSSTATCLASVRRSARQGRFAPLVSDPLVRRVLAAGRGAGPRVCATWASAWPRRGTSRKGCGARRRSRFRKARSAVCRLSIGSPVICWRSCRGCGKQYNRSVADYRRGQPHSQHAPIPCPTWRWKTTGSKRRSGFGTATIRAAGGCSCGSGATRSCCPTGSRIEHALDAVARGRRRHAPPSNWPSWPAAASGCARGP